MYEKHDSELAAELVRKSKLFEEALSENEQAESALQKAALQYKEEEGKEEAREQVFRELDRLQGYLPTVKEIDQKQQRVAQLAAEVEKLSKQVVDAQNQLDALQSERVTNAAQVKELEEKVVLLPAATEKLTLLRQQAAIIQDYNNLVQKSEKEQQEEREHRAAFEQTERDYSIVEDRWIEGQAGLLASHLHDGESCPVCGSLDHPKKAAVAGDIPTKEELERLRKEKSAAEKKHLESVAKLAATGQLMKEKQNQLLEQGFSIEGIQGVFAELVKEGKALAEEEKLLKVDNAKLAPLKLGLETLDSKLDELRKQKEQALNLCNDKKTTHATEKALYDQSLAALPEDVLRLEQLEQRIRQTEDTKKQLDSAWKKAQVQYQEANDRSIKALANRNNAESLKNEAVSNKDKAHQSYMSALEQAGFETEEAYKAAKMTEAARAELKQQIEVYKTAMLSLIKQIEEMSAALAGKERHDLDALQQQLQEWEKYIDSIRSGYIHNENNYDKGTEFKANILIAESTWQDAEREHQLVKDLYDVVRGENGKKISFERYLQIEFLEKIIQNANQRLQRMSSGQFYLVRSDRMEKRGKQSGLGFDVYDNYTGQLRDVKTLSGGEKFNASLCLALGMADVIQSYEGGISLETMFIDEGFGSLDEESLNKAIDTLIDLQQSGRMIGVISHVQELKQAIPAILEVKKTREGFSYTNFYVS
ncbi:Nuclease SbcCD subunit C [compost metagenome]